MMKITTVLKWNFIKNNNSNKSTSNVFCSVIRDFVFLAKTD